MAKVSEVSNAVRQRSQLVALQINPCQLVEQPKIRLHKHDDRRVMRVQLTARVAIELLLASRREILGKSTAFKPQLKGEPSEPSNVPMSSTDRLVSALSDRSRRSPVCMHVRMYVRMYVCLCVRM